MATLFEKQQADQEASAVLDGLRQIRSAVTTIKAKMTDLGALKTKWDADTTGVYSDADKAALTAILAPWTTVPPQPLTMQQTAQAFLDSNLGT